MGGEFTPAELQEMRKQAKATGVIHCPKSTPENPHNMKYIKSSFGKEECYCEQCHYSIPFYEKYLTN